jgi:hypothetical protein
MSTLPTWASWAIVAACPLLGPVIALLVFLAVVVLDRWITGAREAPTLVPVAASTIARFLRRTLSLRPEVEQIRAELQKGTGIIKTANKGKRGAADQSDDEAGGVIIVKISKILVG